MLTRVNPAAANHRLSARGENRGPSMTTIVPPSTTSGSPVTAEPNVGQHGSAKATCPAPESKKLYKPLPPITPSTYALSCTPMTRSQGGQSFAVDRRRPTANTPQRDCPRHCRHRSRGLAARGSLVEGATGSGRRGRVDHRG